MKTKLHILLTAAVIAAPAVLFAEDPQTPGKAATSTTSQTPKIEAPALPASSAGEALEKDKDSGKQGTSTAPAPSKAHGDTVSGNPAPNKTGGSAEAKAETKAEDSIAAEAKQSTTTTSTAAQAREAGQKAAGAPVAGSAGSVGGTKASQ